MVRFPLGAPIKSISDKTAGLVSTKFAYAKTNNWEDAMAKPTKADAEAAIRVLIEWAGDDPHREGLIDTPARVARSYRELFAGYTDNPRDYLKRTFEEVGGYDELVVLRNIRLVSFCEHHMLPVIGHAHVGYLPTALTR